MPAVYFNSLSPGGGGGGALTWNVWSPNSHQMLTHWPLGNLNAILGTKFSNTIESTKTTSMEDVSTRVLEKIKKNSVNNSWGISCELALRWRSLDLNDDKSTLVQVMAWCRQASIHYLSQWWPRSLSPYGVTRPRWVSISQSLLMALSTGKSHTTWAVAVMIDQHWFRLWLCAVRQAPSRYFRLYDLNC